MVMDYANIRAVNWSTLKYLSTSPLMYRWRLGHPEPRKPSWIIGGAIHCAILEPEKFDSRYAVFDGTRRGKVWDEWQEENPGVESLKPDEMERVLAASAAVLDHRVAAGILKGGRREEPITWTDQETGLACKGRLDYIRPDVVVDLKSTRDIAPKKFEIASAKYAYQAQLALYHDGAVAAGKIDGKLAPFLIAVQSDEPFDVAAFALKPSTVEAGRALYRSLLRRLIECDAADYWPGCAPDLQLLDLPPWYEGQTVSAEEDEF